MILHNRQIHNLHNQKSSRLNNNITRQNSTVFSKLHQTKVQILKVSSLLFKPNLHNLAANWSNSSCKINRSVPIPKTTNQQLLLTILNYYYFWNYSLCSIANSSVPSPNKSSVFTSDCFILKFSSKIYIDKELTSGDIIRWMLLMQLYPFIWL
jgi:hypothetical protein